MLWGLLVVLAVMAAAFWVLKQFTRGGLAGSGPMRTVGAISVGPKERVVLIECNGAWVMVGTAPGRVNALHAMPAPAGGFSASSTAPSASGTPAAQVPVPPFMRWMEKALQGKGK
jgi:flagellar protein FliO/FliZ